MGRGNELTLRTDGRDDQRDRVDHTFRGPVSCQFRRCAEVDRSRVRTAKSQRPAYRLAFSQLTVLVKETNRIALSCKTLCCETHSLASPLDPLCSIRAVTPGGFFLFGHEKRYGIGGERAFGFEESDDLVRRGKEMRRRPSARIIESFIAFLPVPQLMMLSAGSGQGASTCTRY